MKLTRAEVYHAIDTEREYQSKKWSNNTPDGSEDIHSPEEWFMYMEDYINEAKHILSRDSERTAYPQVMDIMRKVVAMGVCAMEQLGTTNREE